MTSHDSFARVTRVLPQAYVVEPHRTAPLPKVKMSVFVVRGSFSCSVCVTSFVFNHSFALCPRRLCVPRSPVNVIGIILVPLYYRSASGATRGPGGAGSAGGDGGAHAFGRLASGQAEADDRCSVCSYIGRCPVNKPLSQAEFESAVKVRSGVGWGGVEWSSAGYGGGEG